MLKSPFREDRTTVPFIVTVTMIWGQIIGCLLQGSAMVIVCFIGLYIKQSWMKAFGLPLSSIPPLLLSNLNPFFIVISVGLIMIPILGQVYALVRHQAPPSRPQGPNEGVYLLTSWILPLCIFALHLEVQATLHHAFFMAFMFTSLNSALTLIVEPRLSRFISRGSSAVGPTPTIMASAPAMMTPVPVATTLAPAMPAPATPAPAAPTPACMTPLFDAQQPAPTDTPTPAIARNENPPKNNL